MSKDLDSPEIVYRGSLRVSHCMRSTSEEQGREAKDFAGRPDLLTGTQARRLPWDSPATATALFGWLHSSASTLRLRFGWRSSGGNQQTYFGCGTTFLFHRISARKARRILEQSGRIVQHSRSSGRLTPPLISSRSWQNGCSLRGPAEAFGQPALVRRRNSAVMAHLAKHPALGWLIA